MMTKDLEALIVEYLSYNLTHTAVNRITGVHVAIVKDVEKSHLKRKHDGPPKERARFVAIDEISIHSHHRYATVVINLETGHVLFCEAGKRKEQACHFIEWAGEGWMKGVQAVAMDMNAQYDSAFREMAPHVSIVYDHFHLAKMYNETLTKIRRRLQSTLDKDDERYRLLKGNRYILLSRRQTLERKDEDARSNNRLIFEEYERKGLPIPAGMRKMRVDNVRRLEDLMTANGELSVAYVLGEQFSFAYRVDSTAKLEEGMREWCRLATASAVPELVSFAQTVISHMQGIVNHAAFNISSGRLEGTNNLAKVIKRTAYGYHDDEYFFLRLKEASFQPRFIPKSHRNL